MVCMQRKQKEMSEEDKIYRQEKAKKDAETKAARANIAANWHGSRKR